MQRKTEVLPVFLEASDPGLSLARSGLMASQGTRILRSPTANPPKLDLPCPEKSGLMDRSAILIS